MKTRLSLLLLTLLTFLIPLSGFSQAGTLDFTYGTNGISIIDIGTSHDVAWDMVGLSDTTTMITGTTFIGSSTSGFLMHVMEDGTQDMNFGTGGIVEFQLGTATYPRKILLQADGRYIVVGEVSVTGADGEMFIARFNPDGSPDLSFNTTGHFITSYDPTGVETCQAVAIQADGKYIIAGRNDPNTGFSNLLFARVNTNGTLDASFGTNGFTEINASVQDERINSLELLSNGTIVGVGYGYQSSPYFGELLFLAKLTPSGSPMPGFGTNGVIVPALFSDISVGWDLHVVNDSLLITGYIYDVSNNQEFFVSKHDSAGVAAASFGTNGITTLQINPTNTGFRIDKYGDGKYYVCGTTGLGGPNNRDFLLARLNGNGSLDATFNTTGYVTTDIQPAWDEAYGMIMQPDGKVVLAGMSSGFPSQPNFVGITRYLNDYIPMGCFAGFTASDTLICISGQVSFTDDSWSTEGPITSWEWSFEGGIPASSTVENPTVTYNNTGNFGVQLIVSDGSLSDTLLMEGYISVEDLPVAPGTPTGTTGLCGGYEGTYTVDEVNFADEYQWQVTPASAGTISGNSTIAAFEASLTYTGTCTIQARAEGFCGTGPWSSGLQVNVFHNPVSFNLVGDGAYCEGDPGAEIILDGSETGVDYELYFEGDPTGNIIAGTGSAISFGIFNTVGLYTASGYTNDCFEYMVGQIYVHLNPLPAQAGVPVGPEEVCDGDTTTYSTSTLSNTDFYAWSLVPEEAGVISSTDENVTIYWNEGFNGTAGLSVHAENECGAGPESEVLNIEVYLRPAPAISGPQTVCDNTEEIYMTAEVTGNFYSWEVTGGIITGGAGTHQVTIMWGNAGNGTITVMEESPAGCYTTTEEYGVVIEECTAIEETSSGGGISVYPNPAVERINLVFERPLDEDVSVIISSLPGMVMILDRAPSGCDSFQVDISGLSEGIYIVRMIVDGNVLFAERIIKK